MVWGPSSTLDVADAIAAAVCWDIVNCSAFGEASNCRMLPPRRFDTNCDERFVVLNEDSIFADRDADEFKEGTTELKATALVGDDTGVVTGIDKKLLSILTTFRFFCDDFVDTIVDVEVDTDFNFGVKLLVASFAVNPLYPILCKILLKLVDPP